MMLIHEQPCVTSNYFSAQIPFCKFDKHRAFLLYESDSVSQAELCKVAFSHKHHKHECHEPMMKNFVGIHLFDGHARCNLKFNKQVTYINFDDIFKKISRRLTIYYIAPTQGYCKVFVFVMYSQKIMPRTTYSSLTIQS